MLFLAEKEFGSKYHLKPVVIRLSKQVFEISKIFWLVTSIKQFFEPLLISYSKHCCKGQSVVSGLHILIFSLALSWLSFTYSFAYAQGGANQQVNNLRMWPSPNSTRLVFDVSNQVKHSIFTLENPARLVVDIEDAGLSMRTIPDVSANDNFITNIRTGVPDENVLRFVFELKQDVLTDSFILAPNELYGHRLVVDLNYSQSHQNRQLQSDSSDPFSTNTNVPITQSVTAELTPVVRATQSQQPILIAIDAGHGGEDPGAIGYRGSKEKEITLAIAKRLKAIIDQDPRYNSLLVRTGDYYIKLHRRREIAKEKNADMFISIHADAFTQSSASGFSVFALSQRGATSAMASALATKENASDLIGGVSLADKDEVLAKVLVDLSMTNTINESVNLGGRVINELGKLGKLHSKRVEQAGFAVLKSPDMPSILIETGFITNPNEESKLRSNSYQDQLARGVYAAINEYFEQTPYYNVATYQSPAIENSPTTNSSITRLNTSNSFDATHIVERGDSLSEIAERYGTSLSELKRVNGLRSNVAVLGARLKVPGVSSSARNVVPSVHTVKRGESLSEISIRYNIKISALKSANNLSNNTVYVGQKIKIPSGAQVTTAPRKHTVKRGDTLSEIAEHYGSSISNIMQANNMRSRTVLLGQTLTIP